MKKLSFILFFAAFLGILNAQKFELEYSSDSTQFIVVKKGENEIFSDSTEIADQILNNSQLAYDDLGRCLKDTYLATQKANSLNTALKKIYPDSSYMKSIAQSSKDFVNGNKYRLKINSTTYQTTGRPNGRIKNDSSNKYWTVTVYSDLYIRINRVDIGNGNESFFLFKLEEGLYRTKDNSPMITLKRKK